MALYQEMITPNSELKHVLAGEGPIRTWNWQPLHRCNAQGYAFIYALPPMNTHVVRGYHSRM